MSEKTSTSPLKKQQLNCEVINLSHLSSFSSGKSSLVTALIDMKPFGSATDLAAATTTSISSSPANGEKQFSLRIKSTYWKEMHYKNQIKRFSRWRKETDPHPAHPHQSPRPAAFPALPTWSPSQDWPWGPGESLTQVVKWKNVRENEDLERGGVTEVANIKENTSKICSVDLAEKSTLSPVPSLTILYLSNFCSICNVVVKLLSYLIRTTWKESKLVKKLQEEVKVNFVQSI